MKTIYVTYNREEQFGTIDQVLTPNKDVHTFILKHLKAGTAKLLIDTEHTLMYRITINETQSNLHPRFEQALSPFFK